jgi:hypothetical protein
MAGSNMRRGLRAGLANALLITLSVLLTYAVAEIVFFRFAFPYLSLGILPHIPDRAAFFLQGSKSQYIPHDYIALLGDSNAQGQGDWMLDNAGDRSKPYHSADVLHQLLHRDVVSLGRAGSGSAEALVLRVTRLFDEDYCYLFPPIEEPKQILIYFAEMNDIDDNVRLLEHQIRPHGADLRGQIDKFLANQYAVVSGWRCHGHFGDTIFRIARYLIEYRNYADKILDQPAVQKVLVNGTPVGAWMFSVPSVQLSDELIDAGVMVFERSLIWLRRKFPRTPMTLVYIPSPAATYRHATAEVISHDIYVPITDASQIGTERWIDGIVFPVAAVYASSQKICKKIREVSIAQGISFIDTRPVLRAAAMTRPLHGPRDWNHLNENGYRALGTYLASRITTTAPDDCDDRWDTTKDQHAFHK